MAVHICVSARRNCGGSALKDAPLALLFHLNSMIELKIQKICHECTSNNLVTCESHNNALLSSDVRST